MYPPYPPKPKINLLKHYKYIELINVNKLKKVLFEYGPKYIAQNI